MPPPERECDQNFGAETEFYETQTVQLIDKAGRIRLIMVGCDSTNEAKLASLIEAMLKEK